METEVTITPDYFDNGDGVYVIHFPGGVSCLGFDVVLDRIQRIVIELVGRGVLDGSYLDNELTAVRAQRGTIAAYDTLQNLTAQLRAVCDEQGEQAVCGLSPGLIGLEGHRVEAVTLSGQRRRFIVARSSGWMPCHLELAHHHSLSGATADYEYLSVTDRGPAR